MSARFLFKTISIAFGIALLLAALFFDGGTASPAVQQATPTNTLSATERLLEPTLPAQPSQADLGAQDYWLYCLPCHGEKGQGLTEEFRQTYPPEEVNCWKSGCHGKSPYEFGFILPTQVPALIEHTALAKFTDAAQLNAYIRATMPFWKPGSLTEDEYWRVTAFLLRQNDLWDASTELNASNAADVKIPRGAFLTPVATSLPPDAQDQSGLWVWVSLGGVLVVLLVLMFALKRPKIHDDPGTD